jgi:hypothetical protein
VKAPPQTTPPTTVNPVSTLLYSARVANWDGAGIVVRNTGAEVISVWIETRITDSGDYARRPVDDLIDIAAGGAKQFDADISMSRWFALVGQSAGAGSTAVIEVGLQQSMR